MLWWTLRKLRSSDPAARAAGARRFGNSKERQAVPELLRLLEDESLPVRYAAAEALGKIGHSSAAEPLAKALSNAPRSVKHRGSQTRRENGGYDYEIFARALVGLGPAACDPLFEVLGSEDREARRWAVVALGLIRDPRAVNPLAERLDDARSEVRKAAVQALKGIGGPPVAERLTKALGHRDPETRRAAAEALGVLRSTDAGAALASAVRDPDEGVQLAALDALTKIGGVHALEAMRMALETGRRAVRDAAAAALRSEAFQKAGPEERAAVAVLRGDIQAALCQGEAAVGPLAEALESRDPGRRLQAARALGQLRSQRAVPNLLRALRDSDAQVQEEAARALTDIGSPALPGLKEAIASYDAGVQRLAATAIGAIGDPTASPALADAIAANRAVTPSYPEQELAARAAASALVALLTASPASFRLQDLEYIQKVPDVYRASPAEGDQPLPSLEIKVDCANIREMARLELTRRRTSGS